MAPDNRNCQCLQCRTIVLYGMHTLFLVILFDAFRHFFGMFVSCWHKIMYLTDSLKLYAWAYAELLAVFLFHWIYPSQREKLRRGEGCWETTSFANCESVWSRKPGVSLIYWHMQIKMLLCICQHKSLQQWILQYWATWIGANVSFSTQNTCTADKTRYKTARY